MNSEVRTTHGVGLDGVHSLVAKALDDVDDRRVRVLALEQHVQHHLGPDERPGAAHAGGAVHDDGRLASVLRHQVVQFAERDRRVGHEVVRPRVVEVVHHLNTQADRPPRSRETNLVSLVLELHDELALGDLAHVVQALVGLRLHRDRVVLLQLAVARDEVLFALLLAALDVPAQLHDHLETGLYGSVFRDAVAYLGSLLEDHVPEVLDGVVQRPLGTDVLHVVGDLHAASVDVV